MGAGDRFAFIITNFPQRPTKPQRTGKLREFSYLTEVGSCMAGKEMVTASVLGSEYCNLSFSLTFYLLFIFWELLV